MKRFITYLYEYEKGQKTKNTGFIRVDERNGKVIFQISVRNFIRSQDKGEIYAFVGENGLQGIEIGKISILNSQTDVRVELDSDNIKDTGYPLDRLVGVGLVFPNSGYMASCWDDAYADVIGSGRFRMWGEGLQLQEQDNVVQPQEIIAPQQEPPLQAASYELVTYQKMELNAIKSLPSPNWYLCNNRFLVHGFFNYGYLVLKKASEADGEKTYLGVPGVYEKPEMVMATLFGFPEFQTLPKEISSAKMEEIISIPQTEEMTSVQIDKIKSPIPKLTELRQGTFGCWLIPVQY